jgi:two-component system response regulator HydG
MNADIRLVVVTASDAFSEFWAGIAERLSLTLELNETPQPVRNSRTAAVILACGGTESHAVDLLHAAHRSGLTEPLVVGAEPDHRLAVELMRRGAGAYYVLPGDADRLESDLARRVGHLEQRKDPGAALSDLHDFSAMIGDDASLKAALDMASRVIPRGRATVLITGETGTGKELLAQAIHYNGPRSSEPFVAVNCGAIPANLLESELFGHEKGAFTDARAAKPGLFEVADGGTLFLDEVAVLPLELQSKLLRALETREVRRVGGVRDTLVDVRILAAANVDLAARVAAGEFRDDLYYRLAVIPIELPPLRVRGRDVILLARHFLAELAEAYDIDAPTFSRPALTALERHSWPGNVRELRNAIERGILLSDGAPIEPKHLALSAVSGPLRVGAEPGSAEASLRFPATIDELEMEATLAMMELCAGNKSQAARRLGITRSRLYRLLERAEAGDE